MRDRRTPAQQQFDFAAKGWAFCDSAMLQGKIAYLETLLWAATPDGQAKLTILRNALSRAQAQE